MEKDIIQERFDSYMEILQKIHSLDHEIDAAIEETEITDIEQRRSKYKAQMQIKRKNLILSISTGKKYAVQNTPTGQGIILSVVDGELLFERP